LPALTKRPPGATPAAFLFAQTAPSTHRCSTEITAQVDRTVESVGRTGNLHFPSQAPPPGPVPHVCTGVAGALRGLKTMGEALPLFSNSSSSPDSPCAPSYRICEILPAVLTRSRPIAGAHQQPSIRFIATSETIRPSSSKGEGLRAPTIPPPEPKWRENAKGSRS